jgi:hypothetical protein
VTGRDAVACDTVAVLTRLGDHSITRVVELLPGRPPAERTFPRAGNVAAAEGPPTKRR